MTVSRTNPRKIEDAIQRSLVDWLRKEYPHVRIIPTRNEASRHAMDLGFESGAPDLVLLWGVDGVEQVLDLELKRKTGRLRRNQEEWARNRHQEKNTHYAVAYGFVQAKEIIDKVIGEGARLANGYDLPVPNE